MYSTFSWRVVLLVSWVGLVQFTGELGVVLLILSWVVMIWVLWVLVLGAFRVLEQGFWAGFIFWGNLGS